MNQKKNLKKTTSLLAVLLILSALSNIYLLLSNPINKIVGTGSSDTENQLISLISDKYVGELPSQKEIDEGKLKGIVNSLEDPFSQYLTAEEFENFTSSLNQKYEGIGISFEKQGNSFVVLQVFDNSPALESGIIAGDNIIKVDGEFIISKSIEQVASLIKGESGSQVEISIIRNGEEIIKNIDRKAIKIDLATWEKINQTAVIEITSFGIDLDKEFNRVAKQIIDDGEIENIVLDLRSNNGGYLSGAIDISSYFLPENTLVVREKSKDNEKKLYTTSKENSLQDYPVNILVDGFTASSSEILASSLAENKDSKIIGQTTFGKGVVQEVFNFNGGLVKITTNEWLTSKNNKIHEIGLTPDVFTEDDDIIKIAIENFEN